MPESAHRRSAISGRVVDASGEPVPGAAVSLFQDFQPIDGDASCDRRTGVFTTRLLPPGRYHLQVSAAGFTSRGVEDVDVEPGATKQVGDVRLERK